MFSCFALFFLLARSRALVLGDEDFKYKRLNLLSCAFPSSSSIIGTGSLSQHSAIWCRGYLLYVLSPPPSSAQFAAQRQAEEMSV